MILCSTSLPRVQSDFCSSMLVRAVFLTLSLRADRPLLPPCARFVCGKLRSHRLEHHSFSCAMDRRERAVANRIQRGDFCRAVRLLARDRYARRRVQPSAPRVPRWGPGGFPVGCCSRRQEWGTRERAQLHRVISIRGQTRERAQQQAFIYLSIATVACTFSHAGVDSIVHAADPRIISLERP